VQAVRAHSLHHVEMALAHFPRIVGVRNGAVAFDLPAAAFTQAHRHALNAQQLHELRGPKAFRRRRSGICQDGMAISPSAVRMNTPRG
jgi:hypothetical protein